VIAVADAVLDVLDAAHAAGVVHRDIKPDNLFVTHDGRLKVLDFGIARLVSSAHTTRSGQLMGTPEFVAPEQAAGRVREIDARTDLFSVGAMMFALLSGEYLHVAKTSVEHMVFAAATQGRSIRTVMPALHEDVAHIIDVATAFERTSRFANAKAMQAALRSAGEASREAQAAHTPQTSGPVPAPVKTQAPDSARDSSEVQVSSTRTRLDGSGPK
jgi:serine/threonine-protein kinase